MDGNHFPAALSEVKEFVSFGTQMLDRLRNATC
jgi:hypothetical protein